MLENETQRQNRKPVLLIPLISTFQLVIIRPVTKRIQLWLKNGRCIEHAHVRKIVGEKVGIATRRREGMGVTKGRRSGDEKAARVRAVWVQLMFHRCKLPVLLFSRM